MKSVSARVLAAWLAGSLCLPAAEYEPPPSFAASDIAPKELLSGPHHEVEAAVPSDGYMPRFTIHSDFGTFTAEGREMLEIRVHEIAALAELEEVSRGEAFAQAMARSAKKTGQAVVNVATKPVETAKAVPAGVGRLFKRIAGAAQRGAEAVAEEVRDGGDDDPSSTPAGKKAGEAVKSVIGANKAKRAWAKRVAVDPYTSNAPLAKKLDDLALASTAGGLTLAVLNPLPAVALVARVNSLAWDLSATDLRKLNDEMLDRLRVTQEVRKALFANRFFTPTLQTDFVAALEALPTAAGVNDAVALAAAQADSEEDARFFRRAAQILARQDQAGEPLARLEASRSIFVARRASGVMIVPAPVDLLTWTGELDELTAKPECAGSRCEIWLHGRATDRARSELRARGWLLRESVVGKP